jgi:hypothetical protein
VTPNRPLHARIRRRVGDVWSRLPHELQPPRLRNRKHWAIGLYGGPDPLSLRPIPGIRNPIIDRHAVHDLDAGFVADPFLLRWDERWYLFFEVLEASTEIGVIATASSTDGRRWTYGGVAIAEPYHLSYPVPLVVDGVPHLVVESSTANRVRAYRAVDMPGSWEPVADLLDDAARVDPTPFEHDGAWWLFTGRYRDGWRQLELHVAAHPLGPYEPHPANPVVADDARIARPAGSVRRVGDRLLRFGQDCSSVYGERVWAAEIVELTRETYRERPLFDRPVLARARRGWNRRRMHHLDAHRMPDGSWIAVVDGC